MNSSTEQGNNVDAAECILYDCGGGGGGQIPTTLILESIDRLMKYNVFTFGTRLFIQENGTAMGTNSACMYATIYYSYHEETQIMKHDSVKFYRRLIDDAFIINRLDCFCDSIQI